MASNGTDVPARPRAHTLNTSTPHRSHVLKTMRARYPVLLVRPFRDRGVPDHWNPEIDGPVDAHGWRTGTARGSSTNALEDHLAARGYSLRDVCVHKRGSESEFFRIVFTRNHAWNDLPVIGTPARECIFNKADHLEIDGEEPTDQHERRRQWSFSQDRNCMDGAEMVILDTPYVSDLILWASIAPWYDEIASRSVPVLWFDGSGLTEVTPSELATCASRMRLVDRMTWSHSLNYAIFFERTLYAVAIEEGWSRRYLEARRPGFGRFQLRLYTPTALQLLFALADMETVPAQANSPAIDPFDLWNSYAEGCPFITPTGMKDLSVFEWKGSGRYEPLSIPVPKRTNFVKPVLQHENGNDISWTLVQLAIAGLTGLSRDGRYGIMQMGRKIVEKLGRGAQDPDVLLRWQGASSDETPAVDRWLNKAFREMKRRVSSAPATIEKDIPNHLLVYGGRIRLDDDALARPGVREAVEQVRTESDKIRFEDRRMGIVTPYGSIAPRPWPITVWFGQPCGIIEDHDPTLRKNGWYQDLRFIDDDVRADFACIPPALRELADPEMNHLQVVGETMAKQVPIQIDRYAMALDHHEKIVVGWSLESDDLQACDPQFIAATNAMISANKRHAIGNEIHNHGSDIRTNGSAILWEGREIGFIDDEGEFFPIMKDPTLLKRTIEHLIEQSADFEWMETLRHRGMTRSFGVYRVGKPGSAGRMMILPPIVAEATLGLLGFVKK